MDCSLIEVRYVPPIAICMLIISDHINKHNNFLINPQGIDKKNKESLVGLPLLFRNLENFKGLLVSRIGIFYNRSNYYQSDLID